ncbi:RHS repeat-associated core domain-containing protein [Pseudomonas sp. S60]|uniref:RHS repeat-associated core domain-containing protein n=1 Tax=Pseudomonas sp. S60 TaxID=211124 RepID=UPI001912570C|nr:RHS repeat-associated core domain-containing protein [Pseudomonas sp. S60]MBK5008811.1 RHS repeat-associated core domain-containing protein [Pseudomonas sp. S60]
MMIAQPCLLFYNRAQLSMIKSSAATTRLFCAGFELLAEQNSQGRLLFCARDAAGSPLLTVDRERQTTHQTFTAYGHDRGEKARTSATGFNGELLDTVLEGYLLGNGHRVYSPGMMRFYSADSLSPFNAGGPNAYAYCGDDPIGKIDPSGRAPLMLRPFVKGYRWLSKRLNGTQRARHEEISMPVYGPPNLSPRSRRAAEAASVARAARMDREGERAQLWVELEGPRRSVSSDVDIDMGERPHLANARFQAKRVLTDQMRYLEKRKAFAKSEIDLAAKDPSRPGLMTYREAMDIIIDSRIEQLQIKSVYASIFDGVSSIRSAS